MASLIGTWDHFESVAGFQTSPCQSRQRKLISTHSTLVLATGVFGRRRITAQPLPRSSRGKTSLRSDRSPLLHQIARSSGLGAEMHHAPAAPIPETASTSRLMVVPIGSTWASEILST